MKQLIIILSLMLTLSVFAKITPIGFGDNDAMYQLNGYADIYIVDEQGRKTGNFNGENFNEIPGARESIMIGGSNEGQSQINMLDKTDVTLVIQGVRSEEYTIRIARGDHYLEVSDVSIKKGHIDYINVKKDSINIDFDDKKSGNYRLSMNNFDDVGRGTIYYNEVPAIGNPQKYVIDWSKIDQGQDIAVEYSFEGDIILNEEIVDKKLLPLIGIIILFLGICLYYNQRKQKT